MKKNEALSAKRYFNAGYRYTKMIIAFVLIMILWGALQAAKIRFAPVVFFADMFFLVFEIYQIKFQEKSFVRYIEDLDFCLNSHTRGSLINFPSPLVITNLSGEITWYNEKFSSAVKKDGIFDAPIQEILPEIQITKFIEDGYDTRFLINLGDLVYEVWGNVIYSHENKDSGLIVIYFIDKTEEKRANTLREDEKTVECLVIIDNYDEVLKETPDNNHGSLLGEIEQKISQWVALGGGVFRRYEKDKTVVIFQNKQFKKILEDKFDILNKIRDINLENKIPVTLSIGIGAGGADVAENDKFARLALDMALGRGGDQVVIKDSENFNFYGAKTREVEKRTKVKARVVANALKELVDHSSAVIIMGHKNGDLDSLGASIGLFKAVKSRSKPAYILVDKNSSGTKEVIAAFEQKEYYDDAFISEEQALNIYDHEALVIIVDTHRPGMVESVELLKHAENIVLIDHHRRSEDFIENAVLTYHEPYASSTCEMITEILQYIQDSDRLNQQEAEILYAGMFLDTKGFIFKTGVRTFEAAAYLRRLGVNPVNVRRLFKSDLASYIKRAEIIGRARLYRNNIAISVTSGEADNLPVVVAQAADELLDIVGVEASFVIAEHKDRVFISGRSLDSINVQVILEKLGGGGHITIAGAQLDGMNTGEAEEELKKAIDAVVFDE